MFFFFSPLSSGNPQLQINSSSQHPSAPSPIFLPLLQFSLFPLSLFLLIFPPNVRVSSCAYLRNPHIHAHPHRDQKRVSECEFLFLRHCGWRRPTDKPGDQVAPWSAGYRWLYFCLRSCTNASKKSVKHACLWHAFFSVVWAWMSAARCWRCGVGFLCVGGPHMASVGRGSDDGKGGRWYKN